MFFLLFLQMFFITCIAQENSSIEEIRAFRPSVINPSSCGGCTGNFFCEEVAYELAAMESQLQELTQCACCQYEITQADIDTGIYTITEPGVYCLTEDVVFSGNGNAITVNNTVSEVTLDLGGHTITGDGTGVALFVTNTAYGTTIKNGSIQNCNNGIYILDATQLTLSGINISLCQNYGIFAEAPLFGGGGIFMDHVVVRESANDGIYMTQYGTTKIVDSLVVFTGASGLHIDGYFDFIADNVTIVGCTDFGFLVTDVVQPSNLLLFNRCVAESSGQAGFKIEVVSVDGVTFVQYIDCKSVGSNGNGFELISLGGDMRSIEYYGCEAKTNGGTGFFTDSAGNPFTVRMVTYENCIAHFGSPASGGNGDGFYIDGEYFIVKSCQAVENYGSGINLSPLSLNVKVLENLVSSNNVFGINDQGTSNLIYSNVASGNATNYSPAVPLQLMPTDITGYWINVDPTSGIVGEYESKINELINLEQSCCQAMGSSFDVVTSSIDVLDSCAPVFITSLPYIITTPGSYVLCENLSYTGGAVAAITIINANPQSIVLDLNGHSITGINTDIGIQVSGNIGTVTIQNGLVSQFFNGISVSGGNVSINDIKLLDIIGYSLDIVGARNVVLDAVNSNTNSANGFNIIQSENLVAKNCQISGGTVGININSILGGIFENVQVFSTGSYGAYILANAGEVRGLSFSNCVFDGCDIGFFVEQLLPSDFFNGISLFSTSITSSRSEGVLIRGVDNGYLSGILFKDCVINKTNGPGCEIYRGRGHIFENCTITFNNFYGMYISECDDCQIVSSTISSNSNTGLIINGSNTLVKNSIFNNNQVHGIATEDTPGLDGSQIIQCECIGNLQYGIFISQDNNLVQKNSVNKCDVGIFISSASVNSQVLNNYVANNVSFGIYNDSVSTYGWGNSVHMNGFNYNGSFPFPSALASSTPSYWTNIE